MRTWRELNGSVWHWPCLAVNVHTEVVLLALLLSARAKVICNVDPIGKAVQFDAFEQQHLLVSAPVSLQHREVEQIHNLVGVRVLVWCKLSANGKALQAQICTTRETTRQDKICQ